MNMIEENWKTIEEVEEMVKQKTGDPKAKFNAQMFWVGSKNRYLMIPCMYRGVKMKKREKEFTKSHKEMMVYAKFCPFTGKPLYDNSNENNKEPYISDINV